MLAKFIYGKSGLYHVVRIYEKTEAGLSGPASGTAMARIYFARAINGHSSFWTSELRLSAGAAHSARCRRRVSSLFVGATAISALLASSRAACAGPSGGTVVVGTADIAQAGATTTINQSSNKAVIDWQAFSIGVAETVNFNQPSSAAATLNRVVGNERSVISGALNANGQVFIVNAAGVLFTKGAQVNVGSLVASTLDISNASFMAGNYTFSGTSAASVTNRGKIHAAPGGTVALLGKTVSNEGVITANLGTMALSSGRKITLDFAGNSLVDVTIDEGTLNALVANKGAIKADGGRVIMTARAAEAVLSAQVNTTGLVQARTVAALKGGAGLGGGRRTGSIKVVAYGGTTRVAGRLDASAPRGGNGGTIETSGAKVHIASGAVVTTKAARGASGTWRIDPDGFTIAAAGGDITGAQLGSWLDTNGNVRIESEGQSHSGNDGNIYVEDTVTWHASSVLTLEATNDIRIDAPITATGRSAGLVLSYGGFSKTGQVASGTDYKIDTTNGAAVTLSGADASLTINGQAYKLIHDMAGLEAISLPVLDSNGHQVIDPDSEMPEFTTASGRYALAQDLDASGITYTRPVVAGLTGTLAGLGHKIENLKIDATTALPSGEFWTAALVDTLGSSDIATATIRDIGLVDVDIAGGGRAAGFAGLSFGSIANAYVTGKVTGTNTVGGLVGFNAGSIIGSHADVTIAGVTDVGGLVGFNRGLISKSYATGAVTAAGATLESGGLVGSVNIGGLVGANSGTITDSHSSVSVTTLDSSSVGGLVGTNFSAGDGFPGVITNSRATGNVMATATNLYTFPDANGGGVGGLVGFNDGGAISGSTASGNVTAEAKGGASIYNVGGLVGTNFASSNGGTITTSSATGAVTGIGDVSNIGGFAGISSGAITNSFAGGAVNASGPTVGGFAGGIYDNTNLSGNTWNIGTTGQANGIGSGPVPGVTGVTNPPPVVPPPATDGAAQAARAAEAALAATRAANVIATTNTSMAAAASPSPSMSAAGTRATAAIAGPKIEDNIVVQEGARPEEKSTPPAAAPRKSARAGGGGTAARKAGAGSGGADLGATVRSIEVDGQRFDLEDNPARNSAPGVR